MIFRSDIVVTLLEVAGSDETICQDAMVSNGRDMTRPQRLTGVQYNSEVDPKPLSEAKIAGLIGSLMKQKHGSPFESGYMRFHIDAPRAVRDEHVRHRIGSYSSSSLRYNMDKEREVYIPGPERPLDPVQGFKKMRPEFDPLETAAYEDYVKFMTAAYNFTDVTIESMRHAGYPATEALRWLTNDGDYAPYIYRANPRMIMQFLSLRTHHKDANHVSYPMWEIEQVALQIERFFESYFPETYIAFDINGREAP